MLIYIVSSLVFLLSILVVTASNPVTSVVYLIGTFILAAIYLSCQGIYYIALTYIVVYVGAVVTLFLFVVIMINLGSDLNTAPFTQAIPLTIVTVFLYLVLIIFLPKTDSNLFLGDSLYKMWNWISQMVFLDNSVFGVEQANIPSTSFTASSASGSINSFNQIQSIGFELYSHQAVYLVLISIILMVSIVGPIVICSRST